MNRRDPERPRAQGPRPGARLVVLAPNWLGDAVLALPAIAALRRGHPEAHLAVAARKSVADLFRLVPGIDSVLPLQSDGRWWRRRAFRADADALRGFDAALVLPNSFQSAWMAKGSGIGERWGYAADARSRLLTRAVPRTRGGHQAEYYLRLVTALGLPAELQAPEVAVSDELRRAAGELLESEGHAAGSPLVVLAPGAAYGKAKQWIPRHVADLIGRLIRDRRATCVLVGSRADVPTSQEISRMVGAHRAGADPVGADLVGADLQVGPVRVPAVAARLIDLTGRTSLEMLAGVLALSDACVCNDSGAMHLAAAVGTRVIATFGPTNEHATRPLPRPGSAAEVLTHDVWCRPCMLRECPIDHRCMTGLAPERVFAAVASSLDR